MKHLTRFCQLIGFKYLIFVSLSAGVVMLAGCPGPPPPSAALFIPADAKPTCPVSASEFATWFESGAVSLNGVVKPANSVTFSDNPNCDFYKWSEQMFLWLTSPAPAVYGGGAHIFDSKAFFDVSAPAADGSRTFIPHANTLIRNFAVRAAQVGLHRLPVVFDRQGRMFEVEATHLSLNSKPLLQLPSGDSVEVERMVIGENKRPTFFDKAGKEIIGARPIIHPEFVKERVVQKIMVNGVHVFLDGAGTPLDVEQGQAGGNDVLEAQNGSLIYYATTVNDVYTYFLTGTKNGGITPTPTRFPTLQTDLDKIVAFAATRGKTFPDPEALAIEVKSSWIETTGIADLSSYITARATIPVYNRADPNHWVKTGETTTQLALVGIHVVGSTKGHPEMIWATFEHKSNTPNAAFSYINAANATVSVAQNTTGNWLFCASGATGPFNDAHMFFNPPDIDANSPFTISPSNTLRMKAWGAASDQTPNPLTSVAGSNTDIISINNSVMTKLAAGDVRGNYVFSGATWTIGGASPNGSRGPANPGGNEVGTSKLENSTLETYQQGPNTLWVDQFTANCFTCHGTNTTNVSHIFGPLKPLF